MIGWKVPGYLPTQILLHRILSSLPPPADYWDDTPLPELPPGCSAVEQPITPESLPRRHTIERVGMFESSPNSLAVERPEKPDHPQKLPSVERLMKPELSAPPATAPSSPRGVELVDFILDKSIFSGDCAHVYRGRSASSGILLKMAANPHEEESREAIRGEQNVYETLFGLGVDVPECYGLFVSETKTIYGLLLCDVGTEIGKGSYDNFTPEQT